MAARRPSAYPPPVKVGEFVQAPEAEEDERIDVGVVFVGAGPAGLAGAIRLGQLLGGGPGDGRAAGRDADRGARQGTGGGSAPAVGRGGEPVGAARPAAGRGRGGAAGLLRAGHEGSRLPDEQVVRGADPDAAAVPQQGQPGVLAVAAGTAHGGAGGGAGSDGAAGDGRTAAAGGGRGGARCQDRRQGAGARGRAARVVRAGRRGARPGDGVVRGDAGAPGAGGDGAVRAERASSRRRGAWA